MTTPFKFWLAITIVGVLYQSIRAMLGLDFKVGYVFDQSYWVGISMILVHLGAVGND